MTYVPLITLKEHYNKQLLTILLLNISEDLVVDRLLDDGSSDGWLSDSVLVEKNDQL